MKARTSSPMRVTIAGLMLVLLAWGTTLGAKEKVRTMLDFRQEIGLTDQQQKSISSLLETLGQRLSSLQEKNKALRGEAKLLIDKDGELEEIRSKLVDLANNQVEAQMLDLTTARKVNHLLTKEQVQRWTAIQAREARSANNSPVSK